VAMDSVLGSGDGEGSGDELSFEDYMAEQEHGARTRHRQSVAPLHYNTSEELDGERGNRGFGIVRGRSERSRRVGRASEERRGTTTAASGRSPLGRGQLQDGRSDSPISNARLKKNGNWTTAALEQAMDAITDQGMKVRVASRHFGIPQTSLRNHLYGRVISRKRGSQSVLKKEEEKKLVQYLFKMQDLGHPLILGQLRLKVAQATQTRETPWSAVGVPGKSWLTPKAL
jgi:hypothetical protein